MKLSQALIEIQRLKQENSYLKQQIQLHNIPLKQTTEFNKFSSPAEKIKLFMSLFRGRSDIYAKRWNDRSGRQGYTPDCALEWNKEFCLKPKIQCKDCKHRKLLPMTGNVIQTHLRGEQIIGVYPLLLDNTCWFLAVDFDKSEWQEDVLAFIEVCKEYDVPYSIERSRSGNGAHVWIFFSEKIEGELARRMGNHLLHQTCKRRLQIQLNSYDRLFPNQDTLTNGMFGNLIALPLQKAPRKDGNSCFVNEIFEAFEDQWSFLASIKKMRRKDVLKVVGTVMPTPLVIYESTLPTKIILTLRNGINIRKKGVPVELLSKLLSIASFNNPKYYKSQASRLSTYNIPKRLNGFIDLGDELLLPRGCLEEIIQAMKMKNYDYEIIDETSKGNTLSLRFHGSLSFYQEEALLQLTYHPTGVLSATTGFGKTVLAAALIAQENVSTLIIVHNIALLDQWKNRLSSFLRIPIKEIGQLGGNKKKATHQIDIATIQTLDAHKNIEELSGAYGLIIVDECHHISAVTFERVLQQFHAWKVYGLTATPTRKDGLQPFIFMQCGPIRYKVDAKTQLALHNYQQQLIIRDTSFETTTESIQDIYAQLVQNDERNTMIFDDVLKVLDEKRYALILTQRVEHIEKLEKLFKGFAKNIIILSGHLSKKERMKQLEKLQLLPLEEERLVIATGQYIGEGFDYNLFDTLFLVMPISWKGTLQQYVGRLHRQSDTKSVVKVYDYNDSSVPMLKSMFEKRLKGYKTLGYSTDEKLPSKQLKLL